MLKLKATALFAALALFPASRAQAENWADSAEAAGNPAYRATQAICAGAKSVPMPPGPRAPASSADCSSEKLYFGLGIPTDPAAARTCALREQAADPDNSAAFNGTAMLMTIYANGKGAPRNPDAAIALACMLPGAAEEMDTRIKHLAALKKDGPAASDFSFCDDVTSGLNSGACAAHDSSVAGLERAAALERLSASWPMGDKIALAAARHAAETFATARGENEIDLSGTARVAFELEAEDAVRDDFLDLQQRLADHKLPAVTAAQAASQDKALNTAYQAVMKVADPQWGTPTKEGIRTTELAWLAYRDAAASFAVARYGSAAGAEVKAWLTAKRTAHLKQFTA